MYRMIRMKVDGADSGRYGARLWSQAMEPDVTTYGAQPLTALGLV